MDQDEPEVLILVAGANPDVKFVVRDGDGDAKSVASFDDVFSSLGVRISKTR
jgi:hypothetical protein